MLLMSLFTSLQSMWGQMEVTAQTSPVPIVEEASILDTSPRVFQNSVPLGEVESYTLSFTDQVSDVVVGQATLVEAENSGNGTHLYLEMDEPYQVVTLALGTCVEPAEEVQSLEPPLEENEPQLVPISLEELLHPRLDYIFQVVTASHTYCTEL